jgi:hypothetical protein
MSLETLELVAGDAAGIACASSVSCVVPYPLPATQPCFPES